MDEKIKERLQKHEIWQRAFFMLFFIFVYGITKFLIAGVLLFQFLNVIVTGITNKQLLEFGKNLSTYVYQVSLYLTFNSEQRPFPFSEWPTDELATKESNLEE